MCQTNQGEAIESRYTPTNCQNSEKDNPSQTSVPGRYEEKNHCLSEQRTEVPYEAERNSTENYPNRNISSSGERIKDLHYAERKSSESTSDSCSNPLSRFTKISSLGVPLSEQSPVSSSYTGTPQPSPLSPYYTSQQETGPPTVSSLSIGSIAQHTDYTASLQRIPRPSSSSPGPQSSSYSHQYRTSSQQSDLKRGIDQVLCDNRPTGANGYTCPLPTSVVVGGMVPHQYSVSDHPVTSSTPSHHHLQVPSCSSREGDGTDQVMDFSSRERQDESQMITSPTSSTSSSSTIPTHHFAKPGTSFSPPDAMEYQHQYHHHSNHDLQPQDHHHPRQHQQQQLHFHHQQQPTQHMHHPLPPHVLNLCQAPEEDRFRSPYGQPLPPRASAPPREPERPKKKGFMIEDIMSR